MFRVASAGVLKDPFDPLPDSLLLCIFNRVHDVKALGRCFAVSKRFKALALQVEDIVVKVDCVVSADESHLSRTGGRGLLTHLCTAFVCRLVKPLHWVHHFWIPPKRCVFPEISHPSPRQVLKNFVRVKRLRIELPGGELGIEDRIFLKWKAEFGSSLESCVILAASSLVKADTDKLTDVSASSRTGAPLLSEIQASMQDDNGNIPDEFFTNGGLKLRVVWTISSLIAASARHYLLQEIICDHPTLESLVFADKDAQGTLSMNKEQLSEFQGKPVAASASTNRTQVPALNLKLWYAPLLDLPGGPAMKGATLVAVRPRGLSVKEGVESFSANAFEEPFCKAAGLLARRRTYLLEMNSF